MTRLLLVAIGMLAAVEAFAERPNFVILFADDLGYGDLGCYDSPQIRTPRLDRMAAEGMRFTNFYAQPICGPSRAALMTGCYPMRVAERGNLKNVHPVLHEREITLAEVLKQQGYATACFGKWDLATHSQTKFVPELMPNGQGFDYFFGTPTSNDGVVNLYRNRELIRPKADMATLTAHYTDEAIAFARQHKDDPFLIYLAHTMPHTRLAASDAFRGKSPRGLYGDVVEELDFQTGRLLDALEAMKLAEKTYVLFTSDNGPWLIKNRNRLDGRLPTDQGGSAGPLRSGKVSTWEGGLRVPTIFWAPGRIQAGLECDRLASTLDVLPTLADLAGAVLPQDRVIDGESITHLLDARFDQADPEKTFYYYLRTELQAVRQGKWKLHLPRPKPIPWMSKFSPNRHIAAADDIEMTRPQLYDLASDVGETSNVAATHSQVVARLERLAAAARQDIGDYNRIGVNQRFFDDGPRRESEAKWLGDSSQEIGRLTPTPNPGTQRRPNLILFLVDDVGYADIGVQGAEGFKTPNLDRMAAEGMRLTDFYVHPVCGVTRASLMTGCYAMRVGEIDNTKHGHPILHPGEVTIAEVLKTAGYATGMIGKWHLAGTPQKGVWPAHLLPNAQGFDFWFGTPAHNGFTRRIEESKFRAQLMRNGQMVDPSIDQDEMDQLTQRYTAEAIHWIREHKDQPFFLYVAHNMAHVVLGASPKFRGSSQRGLYGDVMQELDWSAGQLMAVLKELDLDDDTLMMFTSDNGPWVEQHLAGDAPIDDHFGRATPLRGWKMTTWEGGQRVPCIVRWPGHVPADRVCKEPAAIMDVLPTFARLGGARLPQDRIIDGRDISPLLFGVTDAQSPHDRFYSYSFVHLQAIRSGPWKLVLPRPAKPAWTSWSARMTEAIPAPQLFDLRSDISEQTDVADQHPDVVKRLLAMVQEGREDLGDFDRIGQGQRFFDEGPRRSESRKWLVAGPGVDAVRNVARDGGGPYPAGFAFTDAIAHEKGVTRRDPSDVLQVDGKYYVWYSKVTKGPGVFSYPSGYSADLYWAQSDDGHRWVEQGLALGKGSAGAWDAHGVFTPNILAFKGSYYLYYTGVAAGHDHTTPTRIGVAVSPSPAGPWARFEGNPILVPSSDTEQFDSMRVDDAAMAVRDGRVWLYYKGRQQGHSPAQTKMGVAISSSPTGPFVKQVDAAPLHPGHEVMVWPQGTGIASLASAAGPRQVYFAADGLHFHPRNTVTDPPRAPGAFRSDQFGDGSIGRGLAWGISHAGKDGDLHLVRFDCRFVAGPTNAKPGRHQ